MKFIKIISIISLILLTACNDVTYEKISTDEIFKDELKKVYSLYEEKKNIPESITEDDVKIILGSVNKDIVYYDMKVNYGELTQGLIRNNNERITVVKIPVELSLKADEDNIKLFLNRIIGLENRIIIGDVLVEKENEYYKVECNISFCGKAEGSVSEQKKSNQMLNIEEIAGEKIDNKIVLRDNDLLMTLRPYTSDSAALSLGVTEDESGESYVFYDVNEKIDVEIKILFENNKYYFECYDINNQKIKSEFKPKSEKILIDILSCSKKSDKDLVGANVKIINDTNKEADVKIFDDNNNRVLLK